MINAVKIRIYPTPEQQVAVNENQVIVVENLAVKNMVKNHNLAKAISDCGWSEFTRQLKYKAEKDGKTYLEIGRFFPSSKTCHVCPNRVDSLPLDVRSWACPKCNTHHDRDFKDAETRGGGDAEKEIRRGLRPRLISGDQIKEMYGSSNP